MNTGNVVAGIMRAGNDCTNALSQSISSTNNQEPIGNTLQVSREGLRMPDIYIVYPSVNPSSQQSRQQQPAVVAVATS